MKSLEAGKIIEERIEKLKKDKNLSEREIERKTKVSRQTIGRYISGEFPRNAQRAYKLISFLFTDTDEREEVMDLIELATLESRKEVQSRREIRKEITLVKSRLECSVDVTRVTESDTETKQVIDKIIKKQGKYSVESHKELQRKRDMNTRLKEVEITITFRIRTQSKEVPPLLFMAISSRHGIIMLGDPLSKTFDSVQELPVEKRLELSKLYCNRIGITMKGLLNYAWRVVLADKRFDPNYQQEKIEIPSVVFWSWRSRHDSAISYLTEGFVDGFVNGKVKYNKSKPKEIINNVTNILREINADFEYYKNQTRLNVMGQKKLLNKLSEIHHALYPSAS